MRYATERTLAARVKALGESADPAVFPELAGFCASPSALVRRLAASALGKLAGVVDAAPSVDLLLPLLSDSHPQVRQYAAKALGAFGADAEKALPALRDMLRNPAELDYVKRSVTTAGLAIKTSLEIAAKQAVHYIEYWGMDTPRYKAGMHLKQDLYMHAGKKLISLYPDDKKRLDAVLGTKLAALVRPPPIAASSSDSLQAADKNQEPMP